MTPASGRLASLVRHSYDVLMTEGVDAWIEQISTPDFVWDVSALGIGRHEGRTAFRRFYVEWTESYTDWFIEPGEVEEISDEVVINAVRQGGRLRGSEGTVELSYGQLGVWEGDRLKLAANYLTVEDARAAALEIVAGRG